MSAASTITSSSAVPDREAGAAIAASQAKVVTPSIWGLTPSQLHDRFWASRGVHVIRLGDRSEIIEGADLYLLIGPRLLPLFKIAKVVEKFVWDEPDLLFVRLRDKRERGYREQIVLDGRRRFVRFERIYGGFDSRAARVALTRDPSLAQAWQSAPNLQLGWKRLRENVRKHNRLSLSLPARLYDRSSDVEQASLVKDLVQNWRRPDTTITRVQPASNGAWVDIDGEVSDNAQLAGNVWIGAGRRVGADAAVIGPAVLWDDPEKRPRIKELQWDEIEPTASVMTQPIQLRQYSSLRRGTKRAFDIIFAIFVLLLTLPIYVVVALAIWLEDGGPVFFAHKRETIGGREFPCIKFRSMRKDAEQIKIELMAKNQADGPQFFIENDPRLTRVGRFIRKTNIDELPQFINVLLGHMAVVGPRPSPRAENQYCPPWREARLSVRPGITGLWQVRRTRVPGLDFQEWIKYDIAYVQNESWLLDMKIIYQTILTLVRGVIRS